MASVFDEAISLLGKGMKLTKKDTDRIAELQQRASGSEFVAFGMIWEGVSLIISNPNYKGTAAIPEEEVIPDEDTFEEFKLEI